MRTFALEEIRRAVAFPAVIDAMRDALIAQSRGECDTPMPMHLGIAEEAEVHIKSSYRRGGAFFALKAAGSFPRRAAQRATASSGMMLLFAAATGDPVALFLDDGWMTDIRTAAVSAMAARELRRTDKVLGVLGAGVQARLQARLHAEVLPLERVVVWGRSPAAVDAYRRDLAADLPSVRVVAAASPSEVARQARLIVTTTPARAPLLTRGDIQPGTLLSCVGSDSPGKQELDPAILTGASRILVDSLAQCARLGELQHALSERGRAVELGTFCQAPSPADRDAITICDFTGLGVEDLAIAEQTYMKLAST